MAIRSLWTCAVGLGLLLWVGCTAATASAVSAPAVIRSTRGLDRSLGKYLAEAGGRSSALVVDATTGQTLFSASPGKARLPASVEKLFTTSAALFEFGSDYRFATDVDGTGSLSRGVFSGKLYLKGGGDPTFGDRHFDADNYGTGASVQSLLAHLRADGVNQIRGSIVGDASIFDRLGGGPDTRYRANPETEGELSGLSYDAGWTNGTETRLQPDPGLWATRAFASAAGSQGIKVARGTKLTTGTTPPDARLLAHVTSPTLAALLKLTNAPSDNFFAETLDKDLGAFWGAGGTTGDGTAVVRRVVGTRLGLSERADDGSGLSTYDRTTATTVVQLLEEMQPSVAFYDSLAVAGVSGTMMDEMLETPAAGNCRGKTGTLHNVANLVGYCTAANDDRLVFAFLENSVRDTTFGHLTEDLMGEALADYDGNGQGSGPAPALPEPDAGAGVPLDTTSTAPGSSSGSTTTTTTTPTPTTSSTSTTTTPRLTTPSTTTTTTPSGGGGAGL